MGHRPACRVLTLLGLLLTITPAPAPALAIPAFARRYKVSCQLCHHPIPALTAFGEQFAGNGFRLAAGEQPGDSLATGDDLLVLLRDVPLAVRLDLYAQGYANGRAATDFQSPYGIKLLSGGPLSNSISYYFYYFLLERGEPGGVEDAFLYFNDIGGAPVDLAVGQFQVSDPLFKRELRLEFEDYAVYRARLGDVPVDLTYDRGVMASADLAGFTVTGQLLNGNGIGAASAARRFDIDPNKSLFLHATRDLGSALRLGGFGYYGRTSGNGTHNDSRMLGVDGTVSAGPVELNGQYIYREDNKPTFTAGEPAVALQGGFGELIYRPVGSRWYGFVLYNRVTADRPLLDVRLGGPGGIRRHQTISTGVGHLLRRNVRVSGEVAWDTEQELARLTAGLVAAF
jgi:hypothetical protein